MRIRDLKEISYGMSLCHVSSFEYVLEVDADCKGQWGLDSYVCLGREDLICPRAKLFPMMEKKRKSTRYP